MKRLVAPAFVATRRIEVWGVVGRFPALHVMAAGPPA